MSNSQSNSVAGMDLASIEKDLISKRVFSGLSYLQRFFNLTANTKLWGLILQVLKDVRLYFDRLPTGAKTDLIRDTFVTRISNVALDSSCELFVSRQEQEWLFFSYFTHFYSKTSYRKVLNVFLEHNGYLPNNVTSDDEKLSYFKTLDHLVTVDEKGIVQPRPILDLMLYKYIFKHCGLENSPTEESNVTFVKQNENKAVKRLTHSVMLCRDNVMYKKLCAIVQLLIRSFGSLSLDHLKRCIKYVWPDVKRFLDEMSTEKQSEVFSSIAPTVLKSDGLYLLPPTKRYTFDWGFGSKIKLCVTHIVCNLLLNGETSYQRALKDFYATAPEANIFSNSPEDPQWLEYLKKQSEYLEFTKRDMLKLPQSFYLDFDPSEGGSLISRNNETQVLENIENSMGIISLHVKDQNSSGSEPSNCTNPKPTRSAFGLNSCSEVSVSADKEEKISYFGVKPKIANSRLSKLDWFPLSSIPKPYATDNKEKSLSNSINVSNNVNIAHPSKSTNIKVASNGHREIHAPVSKKECSSGTLRSKIANSKLDKLDSIPEPKAANKSVSLSNSINLGQNKLECSILNKNVPNNKAVSTVKNKTSPSEGNASGNTNPSMTMQPVSPQHKLCQSLQGCIAYLLQFFEINLSPGFCEVLLRVLDRHKVFSELPDSQQRDVIKASFRPFHVDQQGMVIVVPSKTKDVTFKTMEQFTQILCFSFIVSHYDEQHYEQVLSEYTDRVGKKVRIKKGGPFGYFKRYSHLFKISDSGNVSLVKIPSMKWDYISFVVSEHRSTPLRFFSRIKEAAVLLGKSFDAVAEEEMMRTIFYVQKDIHEYLVAESDYDKCILEEMCSYYESKIGISQGAQPAMESWSLSEEEKDLLVLVCVLVSSGPTDRNKLFYKGEAHGRSAESTASRNLRRAFDKNRDYFQVDHFSNVSLKQDSSLTALNLDAFFKDIDLKESFQSALLNGFAPSKTTRRKLKLSTGSIQKNALHMIYNVCSDVLSLKAAMQNMYCQENKTLPSRSVAKPSFENNTGGGWSSLNVTISDFRTKSSKTVRQVTIQKNGCASPPKLKTSTVIQWDDISTPFGNDKSSNSFGSSAENEINVFNFAGSAKNASEPSRPISSNPFLFGKQNVPGSTKANETDEFKSHLHNSSEQLTTYQKDLPPKPKHPQPRRPSKLESSQLNNNVSQMVAADTIMNHESLHTSIFEEDKFYYNDLINSFLVM